MVQGASGEGEEVLRNEGPKEKDGWFGVLDAWM